MSGFTAEGRARIETITFDARNPEKDAIRESDLRARKLMSADAKLSYGAAVHAVWLDDPDLHALYLNTMPPMHPQGGR